MTDKPISEMSREEYAQALRIACRDLAAPPRAPRKPLAAMAMTKEEYDVAKNIAAKQTNR